MAQEWEVFSGPLHWARIFEEDGLVTVRADALALTRREVLRLVQHLLEAAGLPTAEAVHVVRGITFPSATRRASGQ